MIHPVHQAATEHHAQLLSEAERARCRVGDTFVLVSLPARARGGLRIALLRVLFGPGRVAVVNL